MATPRYCNRHVDFFSPLPIVTDCCGAGSQSCRSPLASPHASEAAAYQPLVEVFLLPLSQKTLSLNERFEAAVTQAWASLSLNRVDRFNINL